MPIDTEDAGLIQDQRENTTIARLVELHSKTKEFRPEIAELCEIFIDQERVRLTAARSAPSEAPTPEPKKRPG